eukprot:m51a1_g4535 putative alpha-( )-fucosyltransferase c-like (254) ;mRNA; r:29788-31094
MMAPTTVSNGTEVCANWRKVFDCLDKIQCHDGAAVRGCQVHPDSADAMLEEYLGWSRTWWSPWAQWRGPVPSQIQITYAGPSSALVNESSESMPPEHRGVGGVALYIASNCVPRRMDYIRELSRHMPVRTFGRCFPRSPRTGDAFPECRGQPNSCIFRKFLYVLAFENTITEDDYVTEKLWGVFGTGSVPVYWGAPNFERFTPGPGAAVDARRFATPKDLAKHLMSMASDRAKYDNMFSWVGRPLQESWKFAR